MLTALPDFSRAHAAKGRDLFLEAVRDPHLYLPAGLTPIDVGPVDDGGGFATMRYKPATAPAPQPPGDPVGGRRIEPAVAPVKKRRDSNAFAMMITLGRAPNNDIVLPDQRVSKFHAYFRRVGPQWTLNDANSMNGTWVDDQAISRERSAALRSGARIRLAETLELVFLEPTELWDLVLAGRA